MVGAKQNGSQPDQVYKYVESSLQNISRTSSRGLSMGFIWEIDQINLSEKGLNFFKF